MKKSKGKENDKSESKIEQYQVKPRSPGMFITNDLRKLSELPPGTEALINRQPLNQDKNPASYASDLESKEIILTNLNLEICHFQN